MKKTLCLIFSFCVGSLFADQKTKTLDFYYKINMDPASRGAVYAVRKFGFGPAAMPTDVDWRIDGLGTSHPAAAGRNLAGDQVLFNHSNWFIWPGTQSRFVFVKTRAFNYKQGGPTILCWRSDPATGGIGGASGYIALPSFQPVY